MSKSTRANPSAVKRLGSVPRTRFKGVAPKKARASAKGPCAVPLTPKNRVSARSGMLAWTSSSGTSWMRPPWVAMARP